jgi:putative aldouronate transport system permease protein
MKRSKGEKVFNVFNLIFFAIFTITMIVPVAFVLKKSLDVGGVDGSISLIPREFSLLYYKMIIEDTSIYRPLLNSIYIVVVGTSLSVFVNAMGAYTLSKRDLPGVPVMVYYLIIIPMMFGGGLIPTYLLMKKLHLINKLAILFIPSLASGWSMILIRNYYWSIPESLIEAATIDGAKEFTIFTRIILPLAKPVLAAITLFTGVGYWNTFMAAIIYINDAKKYTFPVKLNELIAVQQANMQQQFEQMLMSSGADLALANLNAEGLSSAMIIVAMLPVILIYPYLQKHFASGLMVGSVKG